ncbi:hypothetical protein N0V94_006751 [Neodidymelliopsis sp. IMI 364377]|nr:hypothetical protein N0V94_006751 [Neodidymelliopsis sp. IMI 364377]
MSRFVVPRPVQPASAAQDGPVVVDLTGDTEAADDKNLKVDSLAIYNAKKQEVDTWYDKEYTKKLGLPAHSKTKHSKDPWYQKLAAWQESQNPVPPTPTKKRRLSEANKDEEENEHDGQTRPRQKSYATDTVSLPEYPFTSIADFEPMPNGNYACAHGIFSNHLACCKEGLTRSGKKQAIKKSIETWRGNVERLIDDGKLDARHKTWSNWYKADLREKYQPKQQAERRKRRAEYRQAVRRAEQQCANAEKKASAATKLVELQGILQQPLPQQPAVYSAGTDIPSYLASDSVVDPVMISHSPQVPRTLQHQTSMNELTALQTDFLTALARSEPHQLRQYDALYRDAQHRENNKQKPDFRFLRNWYLAYFLQHKRQSLSAQQRSVSKSGNPSYGAPKRYGDTAPLSMIDSLFDSYLSVFDDDDEAEQEVAPPTQLDEHGDVQGSQTSSKTMGEKTSTPMRGEQPPTLVSAPHSSNNFNPSTTTEQKHNHAEPGPDSQNAIETWPSEHLDAELDRILATAPTSTWSPGDWLTVPVPLGNSTGALPEFSSVDYLPQEFATGNEAVSDEMRHVL